MGKSVNVKRDRKKDRNVIPYTIYIYIILV